MATVDEILARQAFTAGNEAWEADNSYPSYALYAEPEYVPVTNKRIADFNSQVSVRGERNTQFVGFALPRYDDSTDLAAQHLYIHYQTATGGSDSTPCNVSKSDSYIRLFWRIPAQAAQEAGDLQMMIYATGTDSAGERTIWKTLPASYTIHDGLDIGGGIPEPDPSWYEQFVAQMEGKVSTAQGYANAAQVSKTAADASAAAAAQSATAATQSLGDTKTYVESQKAAFVGYSRRECDTRYSNALIGQATGSGQATVEDAAEAPLSNLVIAGKSEQAKTTGAQLLDPKKMPPSDQEHGPFPWEIDLLGDGTYEMGGTPGGPREPWRESVPYPLSPGPYYVSGCSTVSKILSWEDPSYISHSSEASKGICFEIDVTHADGTVSEYVDCAFVVLESDKLVTATVKIPTQEDVGRPRPDAQWYAKLSPMLNAGATAKPWEPYTGGQPSPSPAYPQPIVSTGDSGAVEVTVTGGSQSQTVTIPLVEPLRGIGEYQDRIICKDGEWGIERNVGTVDNSKWDLSEVYQGTTGHRYRYTANKGVCKVDIPVLCTRYPQSKVFSSWKVEGDYISTGEMDSGQVHLINIRTLNPDYDNVAAFKTAMANAETIYPLNTPTWEPLPAETQAALNTLTTYQGSTTVAVTADGPAADVGLEYVRDINTVIADLQAQIEALKGGK